MNFSYRICCVIFAGAVPVLAQNSRREHTQPLAITASGVTVETALKELGKKSQVPLTADAALATKPFQIFIRGQSLAVVRRHLAGVLATPPGECLWIQGTHNGKGFHLVEDVRSRQARLTRLRRALAARRQQLESELKVALDLANLSPDELALVRDRYPALAYWMHGMRDTLMLIASLEPAQRDRLLSGRGFNIPYREMSPEQQGLVRGIVGGRRVIRQTTAAPRAGEPPQYRVWRSPEDLPGSIITFRLTGTPDRLGIRVFLPTVPGAGLGWPDALHPPALAEREQPDWMKAALTSRRDAREKRRKDLEVRARKDPDLQRRITVIALRTMPDPVDPKRTTQRYSDFSACLEQVADESGLSIVGDYDPCWDDYYSWQDASRPGTRTRTYLMQDLKDWPLWRALDYLEQRFDVNWDKKGKFIYIRSPRALYAELDGIDMLESRPAAPPRLPDVEQLMEPGAGEAP